MPVLLSILSAIGLVAKNVWSFLKAKALLVWTFVWVVVPKALNFVGASRWLRLLAIVALFTAIYSAIRSAIDLVSSVVDVTLNVSTLLESAGWAGWLIWDGPLQMSVFWDQLISCFVFWQSLRVVSFAITTAEYFSNSIYVTSGSWWHR